MQKEVENVFISEVIYRYLLQLVTKTRTDPYLKQGASPRATVDLVKAAKAGAWLKGRSFVIPADVAEQYPYVISHRIVPNAAAKMEGIGKDTIVRRILQSVDRPQMGEPRR